MNTKIEGDGEKGRGVIPIDRKGDISNSVQLGGQVCFLNNFRKDPRLLLIELLEKLEDIGEDVEEVRAHVSGFLGPGLSLTELKEAIGENGVANVAEILASIQRLLYDRPDLNRVVNFETILFALIGVYEIGYLIERLASDSHDPVGEEEVV